MLITQVPVLLQGLVDDVFQLRLEVQDSSEGSRGAFQNPSKIIARAFASKRHRAGRHFVEDRSEGEQVGTRSNSLPRTCSGDM